MWDSHPPQHLTTEERVRLAFEYAKCATDGTRKADFEVASLAWMWGITVSSVRRIYKQVRFRRRLFKQERLLAVDNVSIADVNPASDGSISGRFGFSTLGEFLDYVEDVNTVRNPLKDYTHIADYALPASLKETPIKDLCPALYDDLKVPKYMNMERVSS